MTDQSVKYLVRVLSHPTADKLVQAALELSATTPIADVSIDQIVAAAGVAKGTFYVHFADRGTFLAAIHQWFHDHLRRRILDATDGLEPGCHRLTAGADAYLDACLEQQGTKAVLLEVRTEPAVAINVSRENHRMATAIAADLAAATADNDPVLARLVAAAIAEAALAELETGRRDPAVRAAVSRLARRTCSSG